MRRILLFLVLIQLFSCSSGVKKVDTIPEDINVPVVEIVPGEIKLISIPVGDISEKGEVVCAGKSLPTYVKNNMFHSYLIESYFSLLKPYKCYIKVGTSIKKHAIDVLVSTKEFPVEHLRVQPRKINLSLNALERVRRERAILKEVYATSSNVPLFDAPFILPLNSKVTSQYGVRRLFNGMKKGQHLGIDFRARVGVPIPTANSGRVAFVGDLFYTGHTVIIDHGMGIFAVYGHMSKTKAEVGEYVPQGAIVGLSGRTGRVSGPHLHWGIKVSGEWVSGAALIDTTRKSAQHL